MTGKENRPDRLEPMQGEICSFFRDKDTANLSNRQKKVYNLLCTGWHSAADISVALHYSDPRSYVRELKKKGINVLDKWVENEDTRYKRYHIKP